MDAPLLQVGGTIDKEATRAVGELVKTIFNEGFKTHMEQETIRIALTAMGSAFQVHGMQIHNSSFVGEKSQG